MKPLPRFLIPVFVLAALVLGAFGVAFARELTNAEYNTTTTSEVEFTGIVESINGNTWTIGGRTVVVDPTTELTGFISVGQQVKVHASMGTDGSLAAREIELAGAVGAENVNSNDNMDDDVFDDANTNDNVDDDIFDDENSNDNVDDDIFDNLNTNDNSDDQSMDENSNDNDSSWNDDNSNEDNGSWNDDNSNDNSSSWNDDNSNDNSHDDHPNNDNNHDDSGSQGSSGHGGDDHGDD